MIVGLCGLAGSGKSTVAGFLVKNHGFVEVAFADPLKRIAKDVFDFSDEQLWGSSEFRNAPDTRYPRGTRLPCGCIASAVRPAPRAGYFIEGLVYLCGNSHTDEGWYHGKYLGPGEPEFWTDVEYLTPRYALQRLGTEFGRNCYKDVWVAYALRTIKAVLKKDYVIGERVVRYSAKRGLYEEGVYVPEDPRAHNRLPVGAVISDVRFHNEVAAIQKAGGYVVRLVRQDAGLQGVAGQHPSEVEQASIPDSAFNNHLANNTSDLQLLEANTDGLVRNILSARASMEVRTPP